MPALPLGVTPRQGLLAILAAVVGAAAFPPVDLPILILVSIALFLRLIRDQDTQTARNLGVVYGAVFGLGTMYWFFAVFGFLAVPLIAFMAIYFGIFATAIGMTSTYRPWLRIVMIATFAVAIEWIRGDAWYLRFPWYTPAHALAYWTPWIASVRWLGTYGLSFVIWTIAAAGALVRPWYWAAFCLLPATSFVLPAFSPADHRALLVQSESEIDLETLLNEIPSEKVDLAVLPEYAYQRSPRGALSSTVGPRSLAKKTKSPVVFGAVEGEYGTLTFSNVAALIDAEGNQLGTFPKQHPVPLMLDGVPGTRRPVFALDQGVLGIAVCYDFDAPEVAASLVRAGATVLVAPTFDAMSWTRIQHAHHEGLFRLRAVENDRWILRAVSSGRSEVIDPYGVPSAQGIAIGEKGFVVLPYAHQNTFALGGHLYMLGPIAAVLMIAFLIVRLALSINAWRKGVQQRATDKRVS
jgi:apolipoprotein N-acyltransferase